MNTSAPIAHANNVALNNWPVVHNELDVLAGLVAFAHQRLIELGCGDAQLARELVLREPTAHVTGVEIDVRQHERNLTRPNDHLQFVWGRAESLDFADGSFDGALMLKSLHRVPIEQMGHALGETARVLRPGGWLYVSEPVDAGALNALTRLFHDERQVRLAAQHALDESLASGVWRQIETHAFTTPVHFDDYADFTARMLHGRHASHPISDESAYLLRQRFDAHLGADGADFQRPIQARLLRRVL